MVHTVKAGDSLAKIAKKHRVSVASLKTLNSIGASTKLKPGQTIIVKNGPEVVQTQTSRKKSRTLNVKTPVREVAAPADLNDVIEHKIKRGDTLDRLALQYDVEKEEIVDLNNLKAGKLKPGKTILIPKPEPEQESQEIIVFTQKPLKAWKNREEQYMLVKVAKSFMGAPYKFGGESVRGLDCSAYVKKIYEIFDVQLPRSAREQIYAGSAITRDQLAVGDLVFFKTRRYAKYPTHVGIYIGNDQFIHSSSGQGRIGVKVDSLSSDYYSRTYVGATRVKKSPDDALDAANASDRTGSNS